VPFFQRRLPRAEETGRVVFATWTLEAGLRRQACCPLQAANSGEEFDAIDRWLDEARRGPLYLRDRDTALMIERSLRTQAHSLHRFQLHAYVVMPNHVHMLVTPREPWAGLSAELRALTARMANVLLDLNGAPFWAEPSYDHIVNGWMELERIRMYIEANPVRAGLAGRATEYAYSSARPRRALAPVRLAAAS
jgi:REP element-mobilizing transposase RayT